ncbi:hypothetical protein Acor_29050 [Acrocarpospora corrugata]|uniref:DUF3068 domain-containing protein n=1 Tax=Acrocarpospora corrugata TaxID=35763 RepID=A0A5M3W147_9ACTN|nr:DUF3068 domain-containing protein [Acrocarpospora corrugata]GES00841.1 hypothetical protein Acor_29050 [Acrocarpospora corrugata]
MRRTLGISLIALGAFLVVLAPLVRYPVAGRLVQAPGDQYGITTLAAENATYFSVGDLKVLTGNLDIIVTTRGDVAQATGDHVVWDQFTAVNDVTNNKPGISLSEFRSAFNKYTGVGVNCCNANIDEKPVRLEGQIYLFPFGVEKKTYKVFNSTTMKAYDTVFVGEETVGGLPVYKFEQKVPPTVIDTLDAPASLFGMAETGNVKVDRVYDGVVTYWVEPTTGAPVNQQQQRHEVLKTADGVERMPAFIATAKFTPATLDAQVATVRASADQVKLIRTTLPLAALILGLLALAAGVILTRSRREVKHVQAADRAEGSE